MTVNTFAGQSVQNTTISATTGIIDVNNPPSGAGGIVNLSSTQDAVSIINSRIQVSSSDPAGTANRRSSASGGNIALQSSAATGVAIQIDNSSQLLSLLENAAPGPGGLITILATGPTSTISSDGQIQADRGGVDIRHNGNAGQINMNNANVHGDIVKIAALGDNGRLNVGNSMLNADSVLKLYAGGTTGQITFVADCTLHGGTMNIIAARTVTINNGVTVTTQGHIADVFATIANYMGFGGNNTTTGTFGGLGANNPQPLINAPPIGPPGGP